MKKLLAATLFFLLGSQANAANFSKAGNIADLMVTSVGTSDLAVLYMEDFSSAGNCTASSSKNLVILTLPDTDKGKSMLSIALAAYISGKPIKVTLNDTNRDSNGYCRVEWLRLNTSF